MSGFIEATTAAVQTAGAALSFALGLLGPLRPASFRGVPFWVETAGGEGGRRIVTHEFPLRERPYNEDMGRAAQKYKIKAFVLGDDYQTWRDYLLAACQDFPTAATLVHPYLGELKCRAGVLRWVESRDLGGYCAFDLEFVEDCPQPLPQSVTDTVGSLLRALVSLAILVKHAYAIVSAVIQHPGLLLGFAANLFGSFVSGLTGLAPSTIFGLELSIAAVFTSSGDDDAVCDAVFAVFTGAVDNVGTALFPPDLPDDPVTGSAPVFPPGADLTGGLATLTAWGAALTPINPASPVTAILAAQQAAIIALVQGAATIAVLQVYATIDWPSADAASAALGQVQTMIDAQSMAAADAGQDDLYRGWQAVGAIAVADLTQRAQQLPRLARYSLPGSLPSLVLAQRLYGDAGRADELVGLNDTPHPAFMARTGYQLVP
jgi:hypothetical protein